MAATVLALVAAAPGVTAAAEPIPSDPSAAADAGPLRVRDQLLVDQGFLAPDPVSAEVLADGRWRIDLATSISNTFAMSDPFERYLEETRTERRQLTLDELRQLRQQSPSGRVFYLDVELIRSSVEMRRGIGHGVEVGILMPLLVIRGGFLDAFIDRFHSSFGFDPEGRNGVTRNSVLGYVNSSRGELVLRADDVSTALGDLVGSVKVDLLPGSNGRTSMALEGQLKLPTGDDRQLAGSGSIDLGAQLLLTRSQRRGSLHGGAGLYFLGEHKVLGTETQVLLGAFAAYGRRLGPRLTAVLQLNAAQTPLERLELEQLEGLILQTTAGMRYRLRDGRVLFAALTENFGSFDNTPDLGVHLGFATTFD